MALRTYIWNIDGGASQVTSPKTTTVSFGDGYDQVSSKGINNISDSWRVSRKAYMEEIDAIYAFLVDHGGVLPFTMLIRDRPLPYRTVGDFERSHLGADVWQISFTVKRAFIP